jgi:plasmid maintenance system antidote protein VapI
MAVRLSKAFGRSPESWLALQNQYDLAQISQNVKRIKIRPFSKRSERYGSKLPVRHALA